MRALSYTDPAVVRVTRVHPFRLWLLNTRRTQEGAAAELGISKIYLSLVLSGTRVPSRELYRDMARLSRGAVTFRELEAFRTPSENPRRRKPKPRVRPRTGPKG
jgi:hypothetical protein